MNIGFNLQLVQTQKLIMTPELWQAIKLLQYSNLELSSFIQKEIEENPVVENTNEAADEIRIQKNEESDESVNLILTTHKDDIWRVIWKEWKVVWAMRTLLRVLWAKLWKKITLTVVEPDKL